MAEVRLHDLDATGDRLGVGRSTIYKLMDTGQLRSVKVGRRRLVPEAAIVAFIESLNA